MFQRGANLLCIFGVCDLDLLFALAQESCIEGRRLCSRKVRINRPVFFFLECLYFAFAFDDQAKRNRLHAPCGKPAADLVPKQRRNLISNEPVEHAPRLLRIHQMLIDIARMLKRFTYRPLCDLIKGHAAKALVPVFFFFLFLFRFRTVTQFFGKMRGNGFAFAVRVRGEIDRVHADSELLQLGDDLLFTGNDDVLGIEIVIDVDAQRALGQIFDVPERGLNRVALAQILLNCFRLGRRFDDN